MDFNAIFYSYSIKKEALSQNEELPQNKEVTIMFLGLEWYWWLVIAAVVLIALPLKIIFLKWWSRREREKKESQRGKWGEEE